MSKEQPDITSILASLDDNPKKTEVPKDESTSVPILVVQPGEDIFPAFTVDSFHIPGHAGNRSCMEDRQQIVERLRTGDTDVHCGSCGQKVAIYPRPLTKGMALSLYRLVYLFEQKPEWYHVDLWNKAGAGGDYAKLEHWHLTVKCPINEDPDKNSSGLWRPTQLGIDATHLRVKMRKHAYLLLGQCYGFHGDWILLRECTKFSIQELWDEARKIPDKK